MPKMHLKSNFYLCFHLNCGGGGTGLGYGRGGGGGGVAKKKFDNPPAK
jgi:hypothetical protein